MIGLVIVTHGRLAAEFVRAMEHVVGPQPAVVPVCIDADDDMDVRRRQILDAVAAVDDGHGALILTDMFGGTPSNLAISVMEGTHSEVVAGLNLPMLIKSAHLRTRVPLEECALKVAEVGRKYIAVPSQLLPAR